MADLDDFIGANFDVDSAGTEFRIHPHVTERVDLGRRGICFPLKPSYDRANETLSGLSDAYGIRKDAPLMVPTMTNMEWRRNASSLVLMPRLCGRPRGLKVMRPFMMT